jgi:hypothetical protein
VNKKLQISIMKHTLLDKINYPTDLRHLSDLDLKKLAIELRNETIRTVSETGGHLGSSLGVVELTVAIHSVFNTPHDKLVWDWTPMLSAQNNYRSKRKNEFPETRRWTVRFHKEE